MSLTAEFLDEIAAFAHIAYADHDTAHNIDHAKAVFHNAMAIRSRENPCISLADIKELAITALFHDARDHKVVARGGGLPAEELFKFYEKYLGPLRAERVVHNHENCSWSKRATSQPSAIADETGTVDDSIRLIVQDADWIEALVLQRTIDYTTETGGQVPEDVCKHIREKLLLIPAELHYKSSLKMTAGSLDTLLEYLAEHKYSK